MSGKCGRFVWNENCSPSYVVINGCPYELDISSLVMDPRYRPGENLVMTGKIRYKDHFPVDPMEISKVIFNDPATIVFWRDKTKTVVKADGEPFDPEKGLAMAISRKALGNKSNYRKIFDRWLPCTLEE